MNANRIEDLVDKIENLQSPGDRYFRSGLFPSFRQNKYLGYRRPDDNIFCTASIVFLLNSFNDAVSEKSRSQIRNITQKAKSNYSLFKNKNGLNTYNFWQTAPSRHFPHGVLLHRLDHFRIPDDIDVTALIFLTQPHPTEDVHWLKEKVKQHTTDGIYSTWFGKNMPVQHDVCALCNLMYLFELHRLAYNEYDIVVYQYLQQMILDNEFLNRPFYISPSYPSAVLITYHYARLLGNFEIAALAGCKVKLIAEIERLLSSASGMNRVLLETAMLKLNRHYSPVSSHPVESAESEKFSFFTGAPLSPFPGHFMQRLAARKMFQLEWRCEALNLALQAERLALLNVKDHIHS